MCDAARFRKKKEKKKKRPTEPTYREIRREKLIVVQSIPAILLTPALLGAVSRVGRERLLEDLEAVEKVTGIERQTARPRRVHHREEMLGPEVTISGVDVRYITEELEPVDLDEDIRGLQAAQARHEELRRRQTRVRKLFRRKKILIISFHEPWRDRSIPPWAEVPSLPRVDESTHIGHDL